MLVPVTVVTLPLRIRVVFVSAAKAIASSNVRAAKITRIFERRIRPWLLVCAARTKQRGRTYLFSAQPFLCEAELNSSRSELYLHHFDAAFQRLRGGKAVKVAHVRPIVVAAQRH